MCIDLAIAIVIDPVADLIADVRGLNGTCGAIATAIADLLAFGKALSCRCVVAFDANIEVFVGLAVAVVVFAVADFSDWSDRVGTTQVCAIGLGLAEAGAKAALTHTSF